MSNSFLYLTPLFPTAPKIKVSKPTHVLHAQLSARLAQLERIFLTGGYTLSSQVYESLQGLQSLGRSLTDYPDELSAYANEQAVLQYMKAAHQLAKPQFWEELSQDAEHPETVLHVSKQWLNHGCYAHYKAEALVQSYELLGKNLRDIVDFQQKNRTKVPVAYKQYLDAYLRILLAEQRNLQTAVFHRVECCLKTGNKNNPTQFDSLNKLLQQNYLPPVDVPLPPVNLHFFPLIAALKLCFNNPVMKKELKNLLVLPNNDALVIVHQRNRSVLAPEALTALIPKTPSRWFALVGRRYRQLRYNWPVRQMRLLLNLVALPKVLTTPVSWDIEDGVFSTLDNLDAQVDAALRQLKAYKTPRFFYADTKKFIAQTTAFCVEQKNIILDKKIERLEAILNLPTPAELERVVDTELGSFIEPIAELIEKVKDEALALQRSESLINASHRWGDRMQRLGNLEGKIKRAALPRDLWINLKKLTSAIEHKSILPKSVFDDLMLQLSLKDALHQPTMQALQETIAPRIEAATIDALDTWTHYFEHPDADKLPTISLLSQYFDLTDKLRNISGVRINHDDLLEPLERAIICFKAYCKSLSPDDFDKDQVLFLKSVVDSFNTGITKISDSKQKEQMFYLTEDIEQYLECLKVGVLPTTRTERFEQQAQEKEQKQAAINRASIEFVAETNQILEQVRQRRKEGQERIAKLCNISIFSLQPTVSNSIINEEKTDDNQYSIV